MGEYRKLWYLLIAVLGVTFSLLGYFGYEVYRQAPPIPERVVSADNRLLMTADSILDGQTAWQSVGGMQLGSIWGHGAAECRPSNRRRTTTSGCSAMPPSCKARARATR